MMFDSSSDSRRQFLKSSTAALLAAFAGKSRNGLAQTNTNSGEDYWSMVRSQFAFSESAVPVNAANLCPSFRAVAEDVARYTADIDFDCSFNNRAKFPQLLENARSLIANQLNVSADEIALVRNTSEANSVINNGLPLSSGDEVIVWDQNHPTNNVAWDVRAERFGLQVTKVSTPESPRDTNELVDSFVSRFSRRTQVVALTHVSNVSGVRLPVKEITEAAHARDIYVHLDGAQTWGAMNLDLRDLGVDSFSASAHKWYMGPKEVGLLYVKQAHHDQIWPGIVAPGWGDDAETDLSGARKFESLGQRDDAALAGLRRAAQLHDLIEPARIEARVVELAERLKTGITELGHELVTPHDPSLSFGVVITRVPVSDRREIVNRLYADHGIAAAPTGGLRLSPTIYNTTEHIDRAIDGLRILMT